MKNKPIPLQVIHSSVRKSISIQVNPDCSVKIRVPKWLSQQKIDEIIKERTDWINKKIEYFEKNPKQTSKPKEYTDGESFYYLGKEYKLKIFEGKENSIERTEDTIFLYKTPKRNPKNMLIKWFSDLAKEVFEERLQANFEIFSKQYQYSFPTLQLRKMKSRWGSMSSSGNMTLNTSLIFAPIDCIDYVIMHELCHLKHKNHGKKFHQLQGKFTPNYKEIKKKLETFSSEIKSL